MTCHETDVLTMASIKIMVFLDVTLCSLAHWYRYFVGTCTVCLHEREVAAGFFKMLVPNYYTILHIPEDPNLMKCHYQLDSREVI
jgi:hypothetical protein